MDTIIKSDLCEVICTEDPPTKEPITNVPPLINRQYNPPYGENGFSPGSDITTNNEQKEYDIFSPQMKPFKRYRRGSQSVLFCRPFFEMQHLDLSAGNSIVARCLSCQVMLRGHKNVSSNFIKHMKRLHPKVYKVYEGVKLLKGRGLSIDKSINEPENPINGYQEYADIDISTIKQSIGDEDSHSETSNNSIVTQNFYESNEYYNFLMESMRTNIEAPMDDIHGGEDVKPLSNSIADAISKIVEEKLQAIITKTEFDEAIKNMENRLEERLYRKLSSNKKAFDSNINENSCLQAQINNLKEECKELRTNLQQAQLSKRQLQAELQAMDKYLHRHQLLIHNIKLTDPSNSQTAVFKLLHDNLGLPNVIVNKITTMQRNEAHTDGRHNILLELENVNDVHAIMSQLSKLKNTGVYIEADMSEYARKRKEKLMVLRKELQRRDANLRVIVRNTQLIVSGKPFHWDEVEGLCADDLKDTDSNAAEALKTITGFDLTEFLNVLKMYDIKIN